MRCRHGTFPAHREGHFSSCLVCSKHGGIATNLPAFTDDFASCWDVTDRRPREKLFLKILGRGEAEFSNLWSRYSPSLIDFFFFLREVSIAPCPLSIPLLFRFVESEECLDLGTFSGSRQPPPSSRSARTSPESSVTSRRAENETGRGAWALGREERSPSRAPPACRPPVVVRWRERHHRFLGDKTAPVFGGASLPDGGVDEPACLHAPQHAASHRVDRSSH